MENILPKCQTKSEKFFIDAVKFLLADRYGRYIITAEVHMDETNLHMRLNMVSHPRRQNIVKSVARQKRIVGLQTAN